jgi:hypothetical protein
MKWKLSRKITGDHTYLESRGDHHESEESDKDGREGKEAGQQQASKDDAPAQCGDFPYQP